jgi:hypothetical protein
MKTAMAAVLVLASAGTAAAQHQHRDHAAPYAGMQTREVAGLSEQQIADLRAGRGMGLALPAEINGYPGPVHVIELAGHLGLTSDQRNRMKQLFDAMKAEAIPAGEALIAREAELDRAFRDRTISHETLAALTAHIGEAQSQLRAMHLKYHLATAELLTPRQRERYATLRGYR